MFRNGFIFRLIGVLLLLGLVAAGGYMTYKAGMAQGIAQSPDIAAAIEKASENGQPAPFTPMYGYGYPHPYGFGHPHFFNPFFALCGSILFLFFFLGAMRMIFFRPWRMGWGHHGHWGKDWEGKVPPMFEEWHKRAHEEKPEEK
jgi:hypothetical protein